MLVCSGLGFIHTLEIVARIINDVVNRERLCGTSAIWWVASARWVANLFVTPHESVDSIYVIFFFKSASITVFQKCAHSAETVTKWFTRLFTIYKVARVNKTRTEKLLGLRMYSAHRGENRAGHGEGIQTPYSK